MGVHYVQTQTRLKIQAEGIQSIVVCGLKILEMNVGKAAHSFMHSNACYQQLQLYPLWTQAI